MEQIKGEGHYQNELPNVNVPVYNIRAYLRLPGAASLADCRTVSNDSSIDYGFSDGVISVNISILRNFH